jgi:hypothetical protein
VAPHCYRVVQSKGQSGWGIAQGARFVKLMQSEGFDNEVQIRSYWACCEQ